MKTLLECGSAVARVQPGSFLAGTVEKTLWRRIGRDEARELIAAAERFDRANKPRGARNGALGHVALEVLRYFVNLAGKRNGRIDPSIMRICMTIHRCKDAVVAALKRLTDHGFIRRVRRFVPTLRSGQGPQIAQATNAYAVDLPAAAASLVARWFRKGVPDDERQRLVERLRQLHEASAVDSGLSAALDRMGASLAARPSRGSA